jgi:hypothetical protein
LGILSVLDIKEKIHGVKAAPKDDKEGDSDEQKDALGKSSISDQTQHGK